MDFYGRISNFTTFIALCRRASGQDLLSVAIDRSVEPNRTGKRNQVNSTRNRRVELEVKYPWAVRKD